MSDDKSDKESSDSEKKAEDSNDQSEGKTSSKSSLNSVGMGASLNTTSDSRVAKQASQRLTPEGGSPPGQTLFDCMAFLIYCPEHKRFALNKTDKAVWMPFVVLPHSKSFRRSAEEGISIVLSKGHRELDAILQEKPPIKENKLALVTRVNLPEKRTITRIIQMVKLDKSNDHFKCCQNTKRFHWWPKDDVLSGNIEKLWGPEVTLMAQFIDKEFKSFAFEDTNLVKELELMVSEDDSNSQRTEIVKTLKFNPKDMEVIYNDFIEHCFPSFFLTIDSFKDYMSKHGYQSKDSRLLKMFNAFCSEDKLYMKYQELFWGLAAMEPECPHTDFRLQLIFRYYDMDSDQNLNEQEVRLMLSDLSDEKDQNNLNNRAKEIIKSFGKEDKFTIKEFIEAANNKEFVDTKNLCRLSKAILHDIIEQKTQKKSESDPNPNKKTIGFAKPLRNNQGICYGCRPKKYEYGLHSVKLDTSGRCVEPRRLFEPDIISEEVMTGQRFSMEYKFNSKSIAQVFIDLIRDICQRKEKNKNKGFLADDKDLFYKYLNNFCSDLKSLFTSEERLMKLNSPVTVIGDIGGQLKDLILLERLLWPSFPIVSSDYVFLGNLVGSGPRGVECVIYLLAIKLISPNKVFLLRGSQEVSGTESSLKSECLKKYGEDIGTKVWQLITDVFDCLPIAVVIDEQIFCANGGIPRKIKTLEDINSLAKELKDPKESAIAYEIMNNEPLVADVKEEMNKGFAANKNRESAYWFDEEAVKRFLAENKLTLLIRANNLYDKKGYAFHFGLKCLTVFSNSNSKYNNDLATVFIDNEKIRILLISAKDQTNDGSEKNNKTIGSEGSDKSETKT